MPRNNYQQISREGNISYRNYEINNSWKHLKHYHVYLFFELLRVLVIFKFVVTSTGMDWALRSISFWKTVSFYVAVKSIAMVCVPLHDTIKLYLPASKVWLEPAQTTMWPGYQDETEWDNCLAVNKSLTPTVRCANTSSYVSLLSITNTSVFRSTIFRLWTVFQELTEAHTVR